MSWVGHTGNIGDDATGDDKLDDEDDQSDCDDTEPDAKRSNTHKRRRTADVDEVTYTWGCMVISIRSNGRCHKCPEPNWKKDTSLCIQCDGCHDWWHAEHAGVEEADVDKSFFCIRCTH